MNDEFEPLKKEHIMHFRYGAYLTGFYLMPKRVDSAVEGLKKTISDSYKQGLVVDEEYLLNCVDRWLGNAIFEFKSEQK